MIFDRWGNPLGDLPYAIKAIRTRATDGTDTLDITTIGEINKDARLVFKDSMGRWAEYLCQSTQTARVIFKDFLYLTAVFIGYCLIFPAYVHVFPPFHSRYRNPVPQENPSCQSVLQCCLTALFLQEPGSVVYEFFRNFLLLAPQQTGGSLCIL